MAGGARGMVTFLVTDVEGSTRLLRSLGAAYADVLEQHRRILREAAERHAGREIDTQGDACLIAFERVSDAVLAALAAQAGLTAYTWPAQSRLRVRMGIATGEAVSTGEGFVGLCVHRAARLCAAAHGGQVLVSQAAAAILADAPLPDVVATSLGTHPLRDLGEPERIVQVSPSAHAERFPPLRLAPAPTAPARTRRSDLLRREGEPSLQAVALQLRTLYPAVGADAHGLLEEAVRSFDGARTAELAARETLDHVDPARLRRLLRGYRSTAGISDAAAREAARVATRVATIELLERALSELSPLTGEAAASAERVRRALIDLGDAAAAPLADLAAIGRRATALGARLHEARVELRVEHWDVGLRRSRTWRRGVYRRTGGAFVVPYVNEVGVEREAVFQTLSDAQGFVRGLKASRRSREYVNTAKHFEDGGGGMGSAP
jgi:class 3 adenylate cyclase